MRSTISGRVFLGYAVVLVTFAAVAAFGVVQLRRIGEGLALVSQAYHPLTRLGAQLESSYRNSEQATARLLDEKDARTRGALLYLALDYHPRAAREKVKAAQQVIQSARGLDAAAERPFLDRLDGLLAAVLVRYEAYGRAGAEVSGLVGRLQKAAPGELAGLEAELDAAARRMKKAEKSIGAALSDFGAEVEERIDLRVREAGREERRSTLLASVFSLLAIVVGVFVTVLSQRTLAPIARLTQAVRDFGEGRFRGALPAGGEDELGVLAREFNAMADKIAERDRQLQEQGAEVLRSERLAAVGRMAAQITHEIRNPLSSLSLNAELLQEALEAGTEEARTEATALVGAMAREMDRLTEVTEQYLRFARLPKPAPAALELNDAVEDLLDFVAAEMASAGVTVERALGPGTPRVRADPGQLRQVLLNLVRNAREATGPGGRVVVRTRVDAARALAAIEVEDDGPGIPPAVRARVFEPFFSTKERGTGLGLALVQQVVHEHGGELACEEAPGGGALLRVAFPLAGKEAASGAEDEALAASGS
jgi:signal transduction histidine kinase